MRPLIVIRPEPGNTATLAAAGEVGLDAIGVPLQQVEAVEWEVPHGAFDGLLIGSANAIRHGGPSMQRFANLPVYAVGETTAAAACDAGLKVAATGKGGLQNVLNDLPDDKPARLLRIGGAERVELAIPAHLTVVDVTAYRLSDREPDAAELSAFAGPCCIIVHSASAMRRLDAVFTFRELPRSRAILCVLGPRIVQSGTEGWAEIAIAETPDDAALLAMARQMCQRGN